MAAQALPEPAFILSGPGKWLIGEDILKTAGTEVGRLGENVLLVGEEWLLARLRKPLIQGFIEQGLDLTLAKFAGECCETNVVKLTTQAGAAKANVIVGLGGGKCLDSAKMAAARLKLPLVTVPSSAATCAAASTIAAVYDEEGVYLRVEDLPRAADLCILDLTLLRAAGNRLLSAGMADTLAKWLELEPLLDGNADFGQSAGSLCAREACRIVEDAGAKALDGDAAALDAVIEANLYLSAQASCLGGGLALAAHSLCNGLSLVPELRTWLHGELVGVGLLFQDACMKELGLPGRGGIYPALQDPAGLESLLKSLSLPVRLPASSLPPATLAAVIEKTLAADETIHLLPGSERLSPAFLQGILQRLCV